jgi:glutathione peroxidase-family protein
MTLAKFTFLTVAIFCICCQTFATDFYDLAAKNIDGKEVEFKSFKGKAVLIVNVASKCGFTDQTYKDLQRLQVFTTFLKIFKFFRT